MPSLQDLTRRVELTPWYTGNIHAVRTCQRTVSPSSNQPKLLQPEYHMSGYREKEQAQPNQSTFQSSNAIYLH